MATQANSFMDRGLAFKREGKYEEAIAEFEQLVVEDPNSCDGHHQLGLIYGFTGMFDESIDQLQKASTLLPSRVDVRLDLALTYTMLGMNDEAKVEFEEVLRREPDNKRALESLSFLTEPA